MTEYRSAEPPDVILCLNCGQPIEQLYDWWTHEGEGGPYDRLECKPNTIIVKEKTDESSRTDPGSPGEEDRASEPEEADGQRGSRSIPALLLEDLYREEHL